MEQKVVKVDGVSDPLQLQESHYFISSSVRGNGVRFNFFKKSDSHLLIIISLVLYRDWQYVVLLFGVIKRLTPNISLFGCHKSLNSTIRVTPWKMFFLQAPILRSKCYRRETYVAIICNFRLHLRSFMKTYSYS